MSESNRSRYVAIGLVGIGVFAALTILSAYAFQLGDLGGSKRAEQHGYQAEYADRTNQRVDTCFKDGAASARECVEKAVSDNREQQRSEADLRAQREMADWAFWMLIVSTASLGVTSIGTIFLAWQIMLTREAVEDTGKATKAMERQNDIAEDSAIRQLRAYVSIGEVSINEPFGEGAAYISVIVKNDGTTPALLTSFFSSLRCLGEFGNELSEPTRNSASLLASIPAGQTWDIRVNIEPLLKEAITQGARHLKISGIATYTDCFNIERKTVFTRIFVDGNFDVRPIQMIAMFTSKGDKAT